MEIGVMCILNMQNRQGHSCQLQLYTVEMMSFGVGSVQRILWKRLGMSCLYTPDLLKSSYDLHPRFMRSMNWLAVIIPVPINHLLIPFFLFYLIAKTLLFGSGDIMMG